MRCDDSPNVNGRLTDTHDGSLADIDDAHPAFHPPIAHHLHLLTPSLSFSPMTKVGAHLALCLLELDDRVERLDVATGKRGKVHRKRVTRAQRAVHAQRLRWRRVVRGEERVRGVSELCRGWGGNENV